MTSWPETSAQLRFTDLGGHRFTTFATSTRTGQLVRGGRRLRLRLAARWPWSPQISAAISRLEALAPG